MSTVNTGTKLPVPSGSGGDSYGTKGGTSMAAPHVAGTIALMLAINPNLTPDNILEILKESVKPFPGSSDCTKDKLNKCGAGLLDAGKAVKLAGERR